MGDRQHAEPGRQLHEVQREREALDEDPEASRGGAPSVHEGCPEVHAGGVQLWHVACWARRDEPIATAVAVCEPEPIARRRGPHRWIAAPAAASVTLALFGARWMTSSRAEAAPTIALEDEQFDPAPAHEYATVHEDSPPQIAIDAEDLAPGIAQTVPLEERFPTLRAWIHPVIATREPYPPQECRHFGAERRGTTHPECGSGHCGVDLDGPRGQPVVAVAAGTLVRIERHELGLDGRSGRYVRIQHEDGTLTAYMHLDTIADGLNVGDRVEAGQVVGVLGATATYRAPAHLHFSLELPDNPRERGDLTETHYVDPAPYLQRATVVDAPVVAMAR